MKRWQKEPARRRSLEGSFERSIDTPSVERLASAVDRWGWMTAGPR